MGNRKNSVAEVGSILIFALGVFTVISIFTFHSTDPSFFTNAVGAAQNACGRWGALLASFMLQSFGVGSYMLPVSLFVIATTVHRRGNAIEVLGTLAGMMVVASSLTVMLSLHWKYLSYGGIDLLSGGAFGTWIADGMSRELNAFGSTLVTFVVFIIALALSTPMEIANFGALCLRATRLIVGRLSKFVLSYFAYAIGLGLVWVIQKSKLHSQRLKIAFFETLTRRGAQKVLPAEPESEPELKKGTTDISLFSPLPKESRADENLLSIGDIDLEPEDMKASPPPLPSKKENSGIHILPREVDPTLGEGAAAKQSRSSAFSKSRTGNWKLPTVEFLLHPPKVESAVDRDRLIANSQILRQKFADFGIDGEVTAVRPGPVITLYEFRPGPGVKVSRIAALADDLSMALSAQSVRILAPLPGKSVVGIEIPSDHREMVFLREFIQHPDFYASKHMIPVVMGKEIGGQTYLSDLGRMPHLLCAGQTGSGKSVFMNGLICSLFYRFTPDELRMILVDPKFIEFRAYQDMPHLLLPVVDDPKQAAIALKWAVREMERRYRILAKMGARNLASFNQKVDEMGAEVVHDLLFAEDNASETPSSSISGGDWIEAFEPDESGAPRVSKLPYIVVIIDELADLMMIAKKEVEISIARIAQKARAAGIHLVIATQRPSTDVITGLIKANLPSRVSFQLASYIDSKTILDRAGAERLLGQGDMLFIPPGVSQTIRLHGAYLSDEEINKITTFMKAQGKPAYRDEILIADDDEEAEDGGENSGDDALFGDAIDLVKRSGHASASFLQRHLKVGYNRAARMIETMETRGIVGPQDGARPREVLIR